MKVTPMAAQPVANSQPSGEQQARERAMQAFLNTQGQAQVNQNNVSVEELPVAQEAGQNDNIMEQIQEVKAEQKPELDPKEVKEVKVEELDPASKQYAALAKREKALRAKFQQQEQTFRDREAQLADRESKLNAKDSEYKSGYISKQRLQQDALSVLSEIGVSYEDLTNQILNSTPRDPRIAAEMETLKAEIQSLRQESETAKTQSQSDQQKAYNSAIHQIKTDVTKLVSTDSNFETIRATNSVDDVVDLIEQTWKEDGVLLSNEEAAQQVEDYLLEEALKLTQIDKIKKRLAPVASTSEPATKQQAADQKQPQMKTLTNTVSSSRPISARERAIMAFNGTLKS